MALIAPALLAADFARLGETLETVKAAGARRVHIDAADGHFAPEITVGQPVIESIRKATALELDVHLLIERPERYVADFARAGADRLAVHPESTAHLHRVLSLIRRSGAKAGVALELGTPVSGVSQVLEELDFLMILMSDRGVAPDQLTPSGLEKVRRACRLRRERGLEFELEAEGDIGPENVEELIKAGADILVTGSAIFQSQEPRAQLAELIRLAAPPAEAEKGAGSMLSQS